MSETVGVYLKQKISNMAGWITEEVGKENLSIDICTFANNMRHVEVTLLGELLSESSACVTHRDWRELQANGKRYNFEANHNPIHTMMQNA